ncbi:MAG TPA: hypothetical protein VHN18_14945, partial [Micromonosporaceae bacterium]|nr:hypothetical protein [Micromonosporaceae bacterium]
MPGSVTHPRRTAVIVLVLALAAALGVTASRAVAAPNPTPTGAPNEGGTPSLREVLEAAAKGHIEAKVKLDNSR